MEFQASDIYGLYRPSRCALRVRLAKRGEVTPAEPGVFTQLLRTLGQRHERAHLESLGPYTDLSERIGDFGSRHAATNAAIRRGDAVLYQAVLFGRRQVTADVDFIVGIPDLMIREGDGYVIRDCKLARRTEGHAEILRQVELYGWLYEQEYGQAPVRLEVVLGEGGIEAVRYDGGLRALEELEAVRSITESRVAPYEPVGWSKCGSCDFHHHCWHAAERDQDVSVVAGVDQSLARRLHGVGVPTYPALGEEYTVDRLGSLKGVGMKVARRVLNHVHARMLQRPLPIGRFPYKPDRPYVMFDLEGVPPQLDELQKIYLWGLQVFGPEKGPFRPAVAPLDPDGDRIVWERFLYEASEIFTEYGDLPFVHYAPYERTMIRVYIDRYGDLDGIAERVLANLLDLYPITQQTVVLPDPSYSLKVVERRAGFRRSQTEYGGDWSIAKYIEAVETGDPAAYNAVLDEVLTYNREDLEATWAVFCWLAEHFG